jgi:hypothetical protein
VASITNEIESIAAFVEPVLTGATVYKQRVPVQPVANEVSIRYLTGDSESETNYHYRLDRDYQIIYFAQNEFACLQKFEALEQKLNDVFVIPINGSMRYLRVGSFSFSQPFKTEGGTVFAMIGVLRVSVREARTQEQYEKIMNIETRYTQEFEI